VPHRAVESVQPAEDEAVLGPRQLLELPAKHAVPTPSCLVRSLVRQLGLQLLRQAVTPGNNHVEEALFFGNCGVAGSLLHGIRFLRGGGVMV
jgi:hypothetical protein